MNAVVKQAGSIGRSQSRWRPVYSAVAVFALTFGAGSAHAGPEGGQIVAGQGNINRAGADLTVINQQSQRLGINWDSFNVAAHESVVFQQPGSSSIALNRILDHNPSQILGAIDANGQVFLINPSGIIFGESARVNLHSIVASSLDISTEDFMNGNYDLKALSDRAGGLVVNRGLIQAATGGSVTLVGGTVKNEGLIVADYGQVNLAAGKRATLDFDGDRLMLFEVSEDILENTGNQEAAVSNSGTIQADGGQVLLTGRAASDVFGSVVNNSGVIRAGRIESVGGVVRLVAGSGTVLNSGNIDVSGTAEGGQVELLGERVGVYDGAQIDASGATGGGTVLIGGGLQGNDPNVMNADRTFVGATTQISADATQNGDGGTIIVWSEEVTRAYGDLSARGGADGGDGGFVETSSRDWLDVRRTPDVTAPNGDGGTWLIDPNNIAIVASTTCANFDNCPPPPVTGGTDFTSTDDDAEIGVDLINTALSGGADVVITTASGGDNMQAGNITWANGVVLDTDGIAGASTGTLTLDAVNDITIDGDITDSDLLSDDSLNLTLVAGGSVTINGTISLLNGAFTAGTSGTGLGGDFTLGATGNISGSGMSVFADGNLSMLGTVNVGAGTVDLNAGQDDGGSTILLDFTALTAATTTVSGGGGVDVFTVDATFTADLSGGAGNDDFIFDDGALTGTVSGGPDDDDFTLAGGTVVGTINGNGDTNTLTGNNAANTWVLNGPATGSVTGVTGFSNITNATGGTLVDDFTISGAWGGIVSGGASADMFTFTSTGSVGGSINGNLGDDTVVGADVANTWTLNGPQTGSIATVATFSNIANVTGGSMVDGFTISGAWGGIVSGGGENDTFTFSGTGSVGGSINGNAGDDTVIGANAANMWTLNGPQTGSIDTRGSFSNIANVTGGSLVDTFTISGAWGGVVSGGASADAFILTGTGTVGGSINGNGGDDTLTAGDVANTWTLNGAQTGTITAVAGFANIANVVGGSMSDAVTVSAAWGGGVDTGGGDDQINFNAGSSIGGAIDGGAGTDTLNWSVFASALDFTLAGTGSTDGFAGDEAASAAAGFDNFDVFTTPAGLDNSFTAPDTANNWDLTGAQTFVLNTVMWSGFADVTGGSMTDDFTISGAWGGDVSGGGDVDTFTFTSGSVGGAINGNGGDDTLTAGNAINTWTLTGAQTGTVSVVTGGFSNIADVVGGSMTDTFTVSGAWGGAVSTGGGDDNIAFGAGSSIGGSIDGGAGTDVLDWSGFGSAIDFTLAGAGSIDGFAGDEAASAAGGFDNFDDVTTPAGLDNAFTAPDTVNDWDLTGAQTFVLNTVMWDGFADVTGGSDTDNFTISGAWGGDVNGGDGSDNFTLTSGTVGGSVRGQGGAGDSLTAANVANTWTLTGGSGGTVTGVTGNFVGIEDVNGGSDTDNVTVSANWGGDVILGGGMDTVAFGAGSSIGGTLDGGGDVDTLDWSAYGVALTVLLSGDGSIDGIAGSETTAGQGFDNFNAIVGSGLGDSLTAANMMNTWDLNGPQSFILNGLVFDGFIEVTGGTMVDEFTVSGAFGGDVNGGSGNDTFLLTTGTIGGTLDGDNGSDRLTAANVANTWTLSGLSSGTVTGIGGGFTGIGTAIGGSMTDDFTVSGAFAGSARGGAGDDTFTFTTGTIGGVVDGGADTNILTAGDNANTWTITGATSGAVTGIGFGFVSITNINGGAGTDDFTLNADFGGEINGGGGVNSLTAADINNDWVLNTATDGTLNTRNFFNMTNVTGGSMVDAYTINGMWAGDVSGGDGNDSF
ncbi:MAG: filamentous hemagglutinin N-terminal domain-containing protein, partial [Pseudomonadota bacterium]